MLVRAVNRSGIASDKVARIYHGVSSTGTDFAMDDQPVILPGPGELDCDGCEDPTLALSNGIYYVYYTGIARADLMSGPWAVQEDLLKARHAAWDSWHLSTGPILVSNAQRPSMFYNGATQDATWRIGWVEFAQPLNVLWRGAKTP